VRILRGLAWTVSGFAGGIELAALIACCPETKTNVWEVLPGTYQIDNRLMLDSSHGDRDYQLVISADGTRATETYQRGGKVYRTVYALGPGENSPMRSDLNPANERLGSP
jgi:hypothetical protein